MSNKDNFSEKQRIARTVIVGGLNADVAEDVHRAARDVGRVCSITHPLPEEDFTSHGLTRDGCKSVASAILYSSVKEAHRCVEALHRKQVKGSTVWARQLGGEGSRPQKWKVIVRNIPFEQKTDELRDAFSSAGFVWDVLILKGYAFVKFTRKRDAETAISRLNGVLLGGRPVAVDWAVPKKTYDDLLSRPASPSDDESTGVWRDVDLDEEAEVSRRVVRSLIESSVTGVSREEGTTAAARSGKKTKVAEGAESELQRTVFISNLPFDVDAGSVRLRFSGFGDVESFVPVLHPLTKRPRGTGFLKFKDAGAAEASVASDPSGLVFKGRQLRVLRALDRTSARLVGRRPEEHDRRNTHLAREGAVLRGTPAAEGVSASDMERRKRLDEEKEAKLRSPNFHVSRTRLALHNLPPSMDEAELRKLCIAAVTSRATKQVPVICQVRFLTNGTKRQPGKSRGVAFVEFSEHQHALVALRVLNNNPDTFGRDRRPIVGFALNNVRVLGRRDGKERPPRDRPSKRPDPPSGPAAEKRRRSGKEKSNEAEEKGNRAEAGNLPDRPPGDARERKKRKRVPTHDVSSAEVVDRLAEAGNLPDRPPGDAGERKKRKRVPSHDISSAEVADRLDRLVDRYQSRLSRADDAVGGDVGKQLKRRGFEC